jgi:tripartite ATP-independent transporter DctM subunit
MDWWLAVLIIMGGLFLLLASGLPVAFSFLLINLIGAYLFWGGEIGLRHLPLSVFYGVSTFSLLPVPFFILMGEVMFHSGVAMRMINAIESWMGRVPGRLGVLAVISGTLLAALSGSSAATAAVLGKTLVPEMEKRGYKKEMSLGPILGSAPLAIMIPPSSLAVVLAAVANVSVAGVLMGGIIPGLLMALFYAIYIICRCWLQPSLAPSYEVVPTPVSKKLADTVRYVFPTSIVIFLVIGIIMLGVATPSEAAGAGVVGTLILAVLQRRLTWEVIKKSLWGTINVSIMMLMIVAGSKAFSEILAFSGGTKGLITIVTDLNLSPVATVIAMQVALIIIGGPIGAVSMIVIALPIYMPIVKAMGIDPLWFSILTLLNMEMSVISPPFGTTMFVLKGVSSPHITMGDIYYATLPYLAMDTIIMMLMIAFPTISLWLPSMI